MREPNTIRTSRLDSASSISSTREITLPHSGPLFKTTEEYLAYLRLYGARGIATTRRGGFDMSLSECEIAISRQPLSRGDAEGAREHPKSAGERVAGGGATPIGGIIVVGDPVYTPNLPWWLNELFTAMPGRMLDRNCPTQSRFGRMNELYGYEIIDAPAEEDWPAPVPPEPPPGVDGEVWNKLNPAERRLLWNYFLARLAETGSREVAATLTATYTAELALIRQRAVDWAEARRGWEPSDDSRRNALQHALWQCLLTKRFGEGVAALWGDAHEKYEPIERYPSARMDLFNNNVGRMIGLKEEYCESGVTYYDLDLPGRPSPLRRTPIPLSEGTGPGGPGGPPPPPPPPLDQ